MVAGVLPASHVALRRFAGLKRGDSCTYAVSGQGLRCSRTPGPGKKIPRQREKSIYIENVLVYIDIALAKNPREECTLPLRLH